MIKKIELHNFMPFYGTQTIELTKPYTHIIGKYTRNEKESNGSGKSSLLQAIYFCLYGRVQSELQHKDAEDMYVKLYLEDDTILQKGTDGSYINGEKTTNALLSAYVERMFNMDSKMFLYTHCILNGEIKGLFTLTPKEQKKFLMDISEYNIDWNSLYEKSKWILSEVNKKCDTYIAKIDYIDDKMSTINLTDLKTTLESYKSELEGKKLELENFNKQEKDIFKEINLKKARISEINSWLKMYYYKKEQAEKIEKDREKLQQQINQKTNELTNYKSITAEKNKLDKYTSEVADKQADIKKLISNLNKYESSNGKCPILDCECPEKEMLDKTAKKWKLRLSDLKAELSEVEKLRDTANKRYEKVSKLNQELHSLQQSLFMLPKKEQVNNEEAEKFTEELAKLEDEVSKLTESFDSDFKEQLMNDISMLERRVNNAEQIIETHEQYQKERDKYDGKLSLLDYKKKIITVCTKLLSPHGLPYYLSTALLVKLEEYTNEFLDYMNTGVYISPYQELNTLEDYCSIDGHKFKSNEEKCPVCGSKRENKINNQITVYSSDRGIPVDNESTGRKAIFYMALRFGLMKLLETKGKIFIIDEVFANLDYSNKYKMLEMINHAIDQLDIEQVFIVSNDELKEMLPENVIVIREDNQSKLQQA